MGLAAALRLVLGVVLPQPGELVAVDGQGFLNQQLVAIGLRKLALLRRAI